MTPGYSGYPPQQPPKQGMSTGAKFGVGCVGCLGVLMILVMFAGCAAMLSGDPDSSGSNGGGSDTEADDDNEGGENDTGDDETSYAVGDTVSHGSWDITVTSVEQGVESIEDEFGLVEEPSGQYVVMEIEATNTGDSGEYFEPSDQVLMDGDGSMYEYDIGATTGLDSLEKVNPGSDISGAIAYDVPESFELDHILVNGKTMVDDGVRVDLE